MENITLCGASWYEQKYYFNPAFDKLPKSVKDELQIMCGGGQDAALYGASHGDGPAL